LATHTWTLGQLVDEHLQGREWATHIPPPARNLSITLADRKAAWELYVELLTRIATQALDDEEGVEVTALESIAGLFPTARQLMRSHGREAAAFAALVLALFNHRVRTFTAPWHKRSAEGRLADPAMAGRFREELRALQGDFRATVEVLARMAQVPPLGDH
jgi:hypothetical protein